MIWTKVRYILYWKNLFRFRPKTERVEFKLNKGSITKPQIGEYISATWDDATFSDKARITVEGNFEAI
jgi:hypothetical protein